MRESGGPYEFTELFLLALQGEITPEQMTQLDRILSEDPAQVRAYVELMEICTELSASGSVDVSVPVSDGVEKYDTFLQILHSQEHTAPVVEIPREEPPRDPIPKVVYKRTPLRENKFSLAAAVFCAAALLFLILFVQLTPPQPTRIEVATVSDQMDVHWADAGNPVKTGDRLKTNQPPLNLETGIIKLAFDDGVSVLIEGPARFELQRSGVYLDYGRLYCRVSPAGLGFTVQTPTSQFVDLGTEFGVKAELDGASELHVIKGEVQLFAGINGDSRVKETVTANKAIRFNARRGRIENIHMNDQVFVRQIDSQDGMIWRGQSRIDLADIVGGGRGFGTGLLGSGIDPASGEYTTTPSRKEFPRAKCQFHSVKDNPFVDGVFVPSGPGQVVLNSGGQVYDAFPVTGGAYRSPITHGPAIQDRQKYPGRYQAPEEFYLHELTLFDERFGSPGNPAVYMHTNAGITFDLEAIRSALGHQTITRFDALCGIPETILNFVQQDRSEKTVQLEFYVFVDDQCRLHKTFDLQNLGTRVSIPLSSESRFLTFVVADSDQSPDYDWCLLGRPELIIE